MQHALEEVPEPMLYCSGTLVRLKTVVRGVRDGADPRDHPGWNTYLPTGRVPRSDEGGLRWLVRLA